MGAKEGGAAVPDATPQEAAKESKAKIEQLQQQKRKAVEVEDYALAATLKTQIDELTAKSAEQPVTRKRGGKNARLAAAREAEALAAGTAQPSSAPKEVKRVREAASDSTASAGTPKAKKAKQSQPSRDVIGEGKKTIEDLVVGQRYEGKIVKRTAIGAFVALQGYRPDGFCHVSMLSDGFTESVQEAVKIGQSVQARVISTDLKRRQFTLSLQSDAMREREQEAVRKHRGEHEAGLASMTAPAPLTTELLATRKSAKGDRQQRRNQRRLAKKAAAAAAESAVAGD